MSVRTRAARRAFPDVRTECANLYESSPIGPGVADRLATMDVLIAGGHGQIARRLIRLLAGDGHIARGLIRNPDYAADLEADGGVSCAVRPRRDDAVRQHVGGADAIVSPPPAPVPAAGPSASARSTSAWRCSASRRRRRSASRGS